MTFTRRGSREIERDRGRALRPASRSGRGESLSWAAHREKSERRARGDREEERHATKHDGRNKMQPIDLARAQRLRAPRPARSACRPTDALRSIAARHTGRGARCRSRQEPRSIAACRGARRSPQSASRAALERGTPHRARRSPQSASRAPLERCTPRGAALTAERVKSCDRALARHEARRSTQSGSRAAIERCTPQGAALDAERVRTGCTDRRARRTPSAPRRPCGRGS